MKKLTAILLTMLYLLVNMPVAVSLHYCAGELSGIDLDLKALQRSCICDKVESKICCNDKVIIFKSADAHHNSYAVKLNAPGSDLNYVNDLPIYELSKPRVNNLLSCEEYKSPPPGKKSLYILNRVLII